MGADRATVAIGTRTRLSSCGRQPAVFRGRDVDGSVGGATAAAAGRIWQVKQCLPALSALGRDRSVRRLARDGGRYGDARYQCRHDRQHLCQWALSVPHVGDFQEAENIIRHCQHMEACDGGIDGVRTDYTSTDLRGFARRCGDEDQVRRLVAVALNLDGGSRSDAAKIAGGTLQIVRDWVVRFNKGGPDGLATRKAPGRVSILNDEQRAKLAEIVETVPIPAAHGVMCWRLCDLAQWIRDEFELAIMRHTLGRELRALGYRKLTTRPRHRGQKPDDIAVFKKKLLPVWGRSNDASRMTRL